MSLNSVFTDKQFLRDFTIAHSLSDQLEDFEFAFGDSEVFQPLFVQSERHRRRRHFLYNDNFLLTRQFQPQPDPDTGQQHRNYSAVDLDRVLHDEKTKLDQLEHDDQYAGAKAVDEGVNERLSLRHGGHNNQPRVS